MCLARSCRLSAADFLQPLEKKMAVLSDAVAHDECRYVLSRITIMTRRLKVLLVEDSKILVERLIEAIDQIPSVELIGTVDTEAAAIAIVQRQSIDVIILDLHLKQGTGFGVMRALATTSLRPCILVLTNYDLPEYKNAALALGATHFLDKGRDYTRLPELLEQISTQINSAPH
jgi:two-component system, OmpR family, response regulator